MLPLLPAGVLGPGYALLPGFIPGRYSWPGQVAGITLVPEGFSPQDAGAVASAPLGAVQAQAVASSLTPVQGVTSALTAAQGTSVGLAAAGATTLPLVPA